MSKKTIPVEIDGKTIKISSLPIVQYAELLRLVKELPKYLKDMDQQSGSELIEQLPILIGVALPDVINIIAFCTEGQLKKDEIEQMGLDEVTEIVLAIVEVNNYSKIFDRIKKAMAQRQTPVTKVPALNPTT